MAAFRRGKSLLLPSLFIGRIEAERGTCQSWNASKDFLQVMGDDGSDKTARRGSIEKNYEVVMLLGDNLSDFTNVFDRKLGPIERRNLVDDEKYAELWGDKWIVLPNAVYGDFTGAVSYKKSGLTDEKKVQYVRDLFDYYKYTNTGKYKPYQ